MNNQVLYKLVEEVRLQCRFGKSAYESVRASLQAMDSERTFFYVQALLEHARQASRLLWPARAASQDRGQRLRTELKWADDSLLHLRELRAHLEASDEHLDDWVGGMNPPSYVDFNIMAQGTTSTYKQDTFQWNLDPDTFRLDFRGDLLDLRRLADELHRLESACQVWLRTHSPW